jgi:hypothetical protein
MVDGLGEWRWYYGSDDGGSEMVGCASREDAIAEGREAMPGCKFYICQARMERSDEAAINNGSKEFAEFVCWSSGEIIERKKHDIQPQ